MQRLLPRDLDTFMYRGVNNLWKRQQKKLPVQSPEVPETPAKPKKKMSKKKIALIIVAALILVPLASCVYGGNDL